MFSPIATTLASATNGNIATPMLPSSRRSRPTRPSSERRPAPAVVFRPESKTASLPSGAMCCARKCKSGRGAGFVRAGPAAPAPRFIAPVRLSRFAVAQHPHCRLRPAGAAAVCAVHAASSEPSRNIVVCVGEIRADRQVELGCVFVRRCPSTAAGGDLGQRPRAPEDRQIAVGQGDPEQAVRVGRPGSDRRRDCARVIVATTVFTPIA